MLDIIRQAYDNGTREIGFYLIGEPLMNPDMEAYVAHAHKLGFEYIYLTSNGALATIERMKSLISAGLNSIKFSVNAATPETYMTTHGKDDYETVKKNILDLRNYITEQQLDIPLFISFVQTEITKSDVDRLHRDFDGVVDKLYIFPCANQGDNMSDVLAKGVIKKEQLFPGSSIPCAMVFNRLHITCEGYLDACCSDVDGNLAAVDLHNMSLLEAWYSDIMIALRRRHLSGDLRGTLCHNCAHNAEEAVYPLNSALAPKSRPQEK